MSRAIKFAAGLCVGGTAFLAVLAAVLAVDGWRASGGYIQPGVQDGGRVRAERPGVDVQLSCHDRCDALEVRRAPRPAKGR